MTMAAVRNAVCSKLKACSQVHMTKTINLCQAQAECLRFHHSRTLSSAYDIQSHSTPVERQVRKPTKLSKLTDCASTTTRSLSCQRFLLSGSRFTPHYPPVERAPSATSWNAVQLRWKTKHRYPPLIEDELEESFIRGSGPGGQSVNKTSNCVMLKHLPTGVVVKCHETRSQAENRKICRRRLQERLDWHFNRENSFIETQKREVSLKKRKKKNKTRRKYELRKTMKDEEELLEETSEELSDPHQGVVFEEAETTEPHSDPSLSAKVSSGTDSTKQSPGKLEEPTAGVQSKETPSSNKFKHS